MKTTTLFFLACTGLGLVAFAQDPGKKPDPTGNPKPAEPKDAPKSAERPKDSEMTAKDAAIVALDKFIATSIPSTKPDNWRTSLTQPPKQAFTKGAQYEWHMKTNKGEITIRLMPDVAPMHVSSTIFLARSGFYDGLKFNLVIPGFMAQGGSPPGGVGPGYKYAGEFDPTVKHDKPGRVSMANAGPNQDGSQFFLTFVPADYLDGKHTIFGEVISGMDVVMALEKCGTPSGAPTEPLTIEMTWIVVAPAHATPDKPVSRPKESKKKDGH